MADADAAVPAPPTPTPAWRSIAAGLVRRRRALAAAVVIAVIYLTLAMDWLLFASLGAGRLWRAACGEGCAVVAAADGVSSVATASLAVLGLIALVAAVWFICVACNTEADKAPVPNNLAPADQPVLFALTLGMLASMAFVLFTLVGFLLKACSPVKGSYTETIGSFVIDVGVLSLVLMNFFIVLPSLALFLWRRMLVIWQRI